MTRWRRAIVLPVVLVVVGLLALVMAGFLFFVRAELSGAQAQRDAQQARLAALSGLEELTTILREKGDDPTAWWDVPEKFRHALVWSPAFDREGDPVRKMGSRTEIREQPSPAVAWRYSIVAPNVDGARNTIRFGITPEAGKLNLNTAELEEIERLLTPLLTDLGLENAPELIAALLDWLDEDDETRPGGAENEYYTTLEPAYYTKNGPLDTVEELLLVKGWTAAAIYGEDVNRNGLLDANEDDGEASFPEYDNADGVLNPGIAPFVTVWSREPQPAGQGGGGGTGGGQSQVKEGPLDVNTASPRVLAAVLGTEAAAAIVSLRNELSADQRKEPTWISQAVGPAVYDQFKDRLTTRSLQFHVEIIGYGDHTRLARRYEWIIERRGSLVQVLYHRELTALGLAWPVDDDTVVIQGSPVGR